MIETALDELQHAGVTDKPSVVEVARAFFEACETGKGWEMCQQFCTPDATFSVQAEPLADVHALEQYTDWMKGLLTILPTAAMSCSRSPPTRSTTTSSHTPCSPAPTPAEGAPVPRPGNRKGGLRLCHGLPGRPYSPHDEDLAFGITSGDWAGPESCSSVHLRAAREGD